MKILGSLFITFVVLTIFVICMKQYINILKKYNLKYKILINLLRSITILSLVFLLLNPLYNSKRYKEKSQNIDVIFDLSKSIKYHIEKNDAKHIEKLQKLEVNNQNERMQLEETIKSLRDDIEK